VNIAQKKTEKRRREKGVNNMQERKKKITKLTESMKKQTTADKSGEKGQSRHWKKEVVGVRGETATGKRGHFGGD